MFCTTSVLEKCLQPNSCSSIKKVSWIWDTFPKPKSCKTLFLTTKAFSCFVFSFKASKQTNEQKWLVPIFVEWVRGSCRNNFISFVSINLSLQNCLLSSDVGNGAEIIIEGVIFFIMRLLAFFWLFHTTGGPRLLRFQLVRCPV